jgi:hypothetical protein
VTAAADLSRLTRKLERRLLGGVVSGDEPGGFRDTLDE